MNVVYHNIFTKSIVMGLFSSSWFIDLFKVLALKVSLFCYFFNGYPHLQVSSNDISFSALVTNSARVLLLL